MFVEGRIARPGGRIARPLVPLGILADRTRGAAYLGVAVASIAAIGMFLLVTFYLQTIIGFSPLVSGIAFLPFIGAPLLNTLATSGATAYPTTHHATPAALPVATVHGNDIAFIVLTAVLAVSAIAVGVLHRPVAA